MELADTMEGSSNQQSDGSEAASNFLTNLPSRGFLSSTVLSSNPGGMRVYVCEHDTSPPDDQLIKTNQQNILIRSLMLRKPKVESSTKNAKGASTAEGSRKRASERLLESGASTKRPMGQTISGQEGSSTQIPEKDLHSYTVERLRALLKEKGLSLKGKKDELIARLKGV